MWSQRESWRSLEEADEMDKADWRVVFRQFLEGVLGDAKDSKVTDEVFRTQLLQMLRTQETLMNVRNIYICFIASIRKGL